MAEIPLYWVFSHINCISCVAAHVSVPITRKILDRNIWLSVLTYNRNRYMSGPLFAGRDLEWLSGQRDLQKQTQK